MKTSIYEKGRTCTVCGKQVFGQGDSYSIRFNVRGKEPVTCNECDVDMIVEQQREDHMMNRGRVLCNGDHEQNNGDEE